MKVLLQWPCCAVDTDHCFCIYEREEWLENGGGRDRVLCTQEAVSRHLSNGPSKAYSSGGHWRRTFIRRVFYRSGLLSLTFLFITISLFKYILITCFFFQKLWMSLLHYPTNPKAWYLVYSKTFYQNNTDHGTIRKSLWNIPNFLSSRTKKFGDVRHQMMTNQWSWRTSEMFFWASGM